MNKTKMVIKHLEAKGSITTWEAITLYGATRLSAIIFNLRARGFIIDDVWMEDVDRFGNPCRYVKYVYKGIYD